MFIPSLNPQALLLNLVGEGREERAWYTLFAHVLIISVIMHVCDILENIRRYPVYKNTHGEIPKNVLENLRICQACCSAHYCKRLFTWSIISETSGNIINTMLQSVPTVCGP